MPAVVALMVGAFMVRVPVVVNGQGVLMSDTEVVSYAIMPETDGRLEAFAVKVGSPVRRGQEIARIGIPRLDNEIETLRTLVRDLQHKAQRLEAFHAESLTIARRALSQHRGVARQRERQPVPGNAQAVVLDHDGAHAAGGQANVDLRGAGIERVVHQLAHHGGRALDHLAGGDLADQFVGQLADRAARGHRKHGIHHGAF